MPSSEIGWIKNRYVEYGLRTGINYRVASLSTRDQTAKEIILKSLKLIGQL